jgi:hypothetical protein
MLAYLNDPTHTPVLCPAFLTNRRRPTQCRKPTVRVVDGTPWCALHATVMDKQVARWDRWRRELAEKRADTGEATFSCLAIMATMVAVAAWPRPVVGVLAVVALFAVLVVNVARANVQPIDRTGPAPTISHVRIVHDDTTSRSSAA